MSRRFTAAMRLMRKHNPQLQEDGFAMLRPVAAAHLDELMAEFATEEDHGLRCWLLELIGLARSPDAMEFLAEQLNSDDESLRDWAVHGLQRLDTKQARHLLWTWSRRTSVAGDSERGGSL